MRVRGRECQLFFLGKDTLCPGIIFFWGMSVCVLKCSDYAIKAGGLCLLWLFGYLYLVKQKAGNLSNPLLYFFFLMYH